MCTKNCKKEILCKDTLLRFRNKRFGSLSYKMTYKIPTTCWSVCAQMSKMYTNGYRIVQCVCWSFRLFSVYVSVL